MRRRFRAAFRQAAAQLLEVRRHDENIGQRLADKSIVALADRGRALRVDVDQHIDAAFQICHDRFAQRAVILSVHLGVLQKLSRLDPGEKICLGKKLIIFAIDFAGARRARRAGDGINKFGRLAERVTERRFARAGWRGDDEKNSVSG